MAIDTREKRQSVIGINTDPMPPTPTPNASKDGEWRQEVAWGYSGILVSEIDEAVGIRSYLAISVLGVRL